MLSKVVGNLLSSYKTVIGTGCVLVLFVVALFLLVALKGNNSENESKKDRNDGEEGDLKCRSNIKAGPGLVLLILSVYGTIAAGIARLCNIQDSKITWTKRLLICVLCVFALVISGKRIIAPDFLSKSENLMHMPSDLKECMDIMLSDANGNRAGVVTMPSYGNYFEAYSSVFDTLYEDPANKDIERLPDELKATYVELSEIYPDMRTVARTAHKYDCEYIVIMRESYWPEVPLTDLGYEIIAGSGRWDVYKEVKEGNR